MSDEVNNQDQEASEEEAPEGGVPEVSEAPPEEVSPPKEESSDSPKKRGRPKKSEPCCDLVEVFMKLDQRGFSSLDHALTLIKRLDNAKKDSILQKLNSRREKMNFASGRQDLSPVKKES